jgi:hypothetical protein
MIGEQQNLKEMQNEKDAVSIFNVHAVGNDDPRHGSTPTPSQPTDRRHGRICHEAGNNRGH